MPQYWPSLLMMCNCGVEFIPKVYNQKYCTPACQNRTNQREFQRSNKLQCSCGAPIRRGSRQCVSCRKEDSSIYKEAMTLAEVKALMPTPRLFANVIRQMARTKYSEYTTCFVNGYDKHIEYCHIKPIASFLESATIGEINSPSNITVLCPCCHWEFDNGLINAPSIKDMLSSSNGKDMSLLNSE